MAGDMYLLNDSGHAVRGPIAMNLTTAARGVDYIGGTGFYAIDTLRLYRLAFDGSSLQVLSTTNIVNQIPDGTELLAICSDAIGHWIAVDRFIPSGMGSTQQADFYRFDLDGNYTGKSLSGFSVTTLLSTTIDLTTDGMFVYVTWVTQGTFSTTARTRKCSYFTGASNNQIQSTSAVRIYRRFCFNGVHFYTIKRNNNNLAIHYVSRYEQIRDLSNPGIACEGMCSVRDFASRTGIDLVDDDHGGTGIQGVVAGNPVVAIVT